MNNNQFREELLSIIDDLEKLSNEADNENPNFIFIQEIDSAIECLKTAAVETEMKPKRK